MRSLAATLILHRKRSAELPSYEFFPGRRELYDLETDPGETRPLASTGPIAEALQAQLSRLLGITTALASRRASPSEGAALRTLGYLE